MNKAVTFDCFLFFCMCLYISLYDAITSCISSGTYPLNGQYQRNTRPSYPPPVAALVGSGTLYIIGIISFWFTGYCQLFKFFLKITKQHDSRELRRNQATTNLGILEIYGLGVCP